MPLVKGGDLDNRSIQSSKAALPQFGGWRTLLIGIFTVALAAMFSTTANASNVDALRYAYNARETMTAMQQAHDDDLITKDRKIQTITAQLETVKKVLKKERDGRSGDNEASTRKVTRLVREKDELSRKLEEAIISSFEILSINDPNFAPRLVKIRAEGSRLASTNKGQICLDQFNAGEALLAARCLQTLAKEADESQQIQANVRSANNWRLVNSSLLQAKVYGDISRDELIAHYEKIVGLDPDDPYEWLWLIPEYIDGYQFDKAKVALAKAEAILKSRPDPYAHTIYFRMEVSYNNYAWQPIPTNSGARVTIGLMPIDANEAVLQQAAELEAAMPDDKFDGYEDQLAAMKAVDRSDWDASSSCLANAMENMIRSIQRNTGFEGMIDARCSVTLESERAKHPRYFAAIFGLEMADFLARISALNLESTDNFTVTKNQANTLLLTHEGLIAKLSSIEWLDQMSVSRSRLLAGFHAQAATTACLAGNPAAAERHRKFIEDHFTYLVEKGAVAIVPRIELINNSMSYLDCLMRYDPPQADRFWNSIWLKISGEDKIEPRDFELQLTWAYQRYTALLVSKDMFNADKSLNFYRSALQNSLKAWPRWVSLRWQFIRFKYFEGFWGGHPKSWNEAIAEYDAMIADPWAKGFFRQRHINLINDLRDRIKARNANAISAPKP